MTYENYIMALLANFAVEEGYRYGGTDCALAIAQVIANRVTEGWFGGDWRRVIEDAPSKRGTVHEKRFEYDTREPAFRQIISQIDDIYYGTANADGVNIRSIKGVVKSLYYCQLNNVTNLWFQQNILSDMKNHPRLAVVGQLYFFG
jgi:hypothetical protein